MKFIGKTKDPLPFTRESVHNAGTFYDFVGGVFETNDESAIAFLKERGYESLDEPTDESFKCPHCDFVAKNGTGLSAHIRSQHKEKK